MSVTGISDRLHATGANIVSGKRTTSVKVAHLTSVHPHFDIRIFHKECKRLANAGYEVVLIVPRQLHDAQDEIIDGVKIRAVRRPNNRRERFMRTVWHVFRAALAEHAYIYHFHDPELIPLGMLLKAFGKRVVYDVHENVPDDVLMKSYIPRRARKLIAWIAAITEHVGSAVFDGIVAANPVIAKRFPMKKTITVQNFAIIDNQSPVAPQPYRDRRPLIAYVGDITAQRGVNEIIEAMYLLPDSLEARLVLAGRFSPAELQTSAMRLPGWERSEFVGWLTRQDVLKLLARARMGLVLAHPFPGDAGQPNKLFEYMCAGIPVVASGFPQWRRLVEEIGCGVLVDEVNPTFIAAAIRWLLEHPGEAETMGQRGMQAVQTRFNWSGEGEKLLNLYRRLSPATAAVGV